MSDEVITYSFKVCSISVQPDGSEDKEIHVLKPDGTASQAANEISRLTRETIADIQVEDEKKEEENEEELETNELAVFLDK